MNKAKEKQQKADAKRQGLRTRNWTAVCYPEDLPPNWKELLDEQHIRWVESPLHNKDTNADGTPKKPHVHVLLIFNAIKTEAQVKAVLQGLYGASEGGTIVGVATPQKVSDVGGLVRYMAHMDNPEKYQYDQSEIKGHNGAEPLDMIKRTRTESREAKISLEEFIEAHGITELGDLTRAIRYDHPDWYDLVTEEKTYYFVNFLRSQRYILKGDDRDERNGV